MKQEKDHHPANIVKKQALGISRRMMFSALWEAVNNDLKDNQRRYLDIIRSAFEVEQVSGPHLKANKLIERFQDRHSRHRRQERSLPSRRPLSARSTSTYENIGHITASKLIEVLSVTSAVADWPEHQDDRRGAVSTSVPPPLKDYQQAGGLYEKKLADDYEVLVVPKGNGWRPSLPRRSQQGRFYDS